MNGSGKIKRVFFARTMDGQNKKIEQTSQIQIDIQVNHQPNITGGTMMKEGNNDAQASLVFSPGEM